MYWHAFPPVQLCGFATKPNMFVLLVLLQAYKEQIKSLTTKLKQAEARAEFAERSVQKLQKEASKYIRAEFAERSMKRLQKKASRLAGEGYSEEFDEVSVLKIQKEATRFSGGGQGGIRQAFRAKAPERNT